MKTWLYLLISVAGFAGCAAAPPVQHATGDFSGRQMTVYVARRKWHIDVGVAIADLDPVLGAMKAQFPGARYLFFGFGDRGYLLTRSKHAPLLLRALWPGPALLLVTAIKDAPDFAFGPSQVLRLGLSPGQAQALQSFVRASIRGSALTPLADGPYAASEYYSARQHYSAAHTCNTWAAEALQAAALPVHSTAVVFASQVWRQVQALAQPAKPAAHIPQE